MRRSLGHASRSAPGRAEPLGGVLRAAFPGRRPSGGHSLRRRPPLLPAQAAAGSLPPVRGSLSFRVKALGYAVNWPALPGLPGYTPQSQGKEHVSCPVSGKMLAAMLHPLQTGQTMSDSYPGDLVHHVAVTTGLPEATANRVVADIAAYYGETVEEFVRRRHGELQARQRKNGEIWPQIIAELGSRRFRAPELSERQLRRVVYG